MTLYYTL